MVWVGVLGVATFGALAVAGACLPDLAPLPAPEDASDEPPPIVAFSGCGDGLIDTLDDGGDTGESCDPGDAQAIDDAQATGCESCRFTCVGGAIDDAGHCYFAVAPTTTFSAAVRACNGVRGHLVTFSSDREVAFASSLVGDTRSASLVSDAGYWVGLNTINEFLGAYGPPTGVIEPGWPRANADCSGCFAIANEAGTFPLHPEVDGSAEHGCLAAVNGTWLQVSCTDSPRAYTTICEREPVGQRAQFCGGPFCTTVPVTVGSKRYVIVLSPETAESASAFCRDSYKEGSLVVLDTREEREELVREIVALVPPSKSAPLTVWIGLSFDGVKWSWDKEPERPRVSPWGSGAPSEAGAGRAFLRIATDSFDTQLARSDDDAGAGARRAFVCQRALE